MTVTRTSLLRRLRDPADERAWTEFNAVYQPLLHGYVRKAGRAHNLGLNEYDVSDVVQNVFIKLFRAMPTFELDKQRGRFRTWLWRVTVNAMLDRAGRRKKRKKTSGGGETSAAPHGPGETPEPPRRPKIISGEAINWENLLAGKDERPDDEWDRAYYEAITNAVLEQVRKQVEEDNPKKWASFAEHKLKGRSAAEVGAELGINANLVYQNTLRVYRLIEEQCRLKYEEELEDGGDALPG